MPWFPPSPPGHHGFPPLPGLCLLPGSSFLLKVGLHHELKPGQWHFRRQDQPALSDRWSTEPHAWTGSLCAFHAVPPTVLTLSWCCHPRSHWKGAAFKTCALESTTTTSLSTSWALPLICTSCTWAWGPSTHAPFGEIGSSQTQVNVRITWRLCSDFWAPSRSDSGWG